MIIVVKKSIAKKDFENITTIIGFNGWDFSVLEGVKFNLIPVRGDFTMSDIGRFKSIKGVEKILRISEPFYLVTKEYKKEKTLIDLGDGVVVGKNFEVIGGPCSIESEESLDKIASYISSIGVKILRGGAFKLRSSPYSFQGLGTPGLKILQKIAKKYGMKTISEISDVRNLDSFLEYVDIIQIGARNMQNYVLLKELGRVKKPLMLKRSPSSTIETFLLSAEYILSEGNEQVILCERGIKSLDNSTRNTINIASVPILKHKTHLPVLLDPSHGIGISKYIPQVAESSVFLGGDGVMIETHFAPQNAMSDGFQSITLEDFKKMYNNIKILTKTKESLENFETQQN